MAKSKQRARRGNLSFTDTRDAAREGASNGQRGHRGNGHRGCGGRGLLLDAPAKRA